VGVTGERLALNRERVLEAAVDLADREGVGALTMRRLARQVGVEAMTLYYHVGKKDELLDAMLDRVIESIDPPELDAEWRACVRQTAVSAHVTFVSHPWAANLVLSTKGPNRARLRWMNAMLGTLRGAGFTDSLADHAFHAIDSYILGFTLWQVSMDLGTHEDLQDRVRQFLTEIAREDLPHLAWHAEQHLKPRDPDDEGEFVFGLSLILDGLERIRTTS
jgi:AcrR family transcriptional regulator